MSTTRWGQAKREVNALWPLISQRLEESSLRQIWVELSKAGQITVCQSQFYHQVKRLQQLRTSSPTTGRDLVARVASPPPVIVHDRPASSPSSPEPSDENELNRKFVHDPHADLDDLWGTKGSTTNAG